MRTYVISGAASGIGAATAARLVADGHRVIGVDLAGADVEADLATPAGRLDAVRRVAELAPDGVHGV
ncbi:MAG TPA: reductase, partial [Marmoricola sp.]